MIRLATIIAEFGADFLAKFRHQLSFDQVQALSAIEHGRSPASPMMQVQCSDCAHHHLVPHSCGHRLCPHCQHHESQQWLERQRQRLVPADYFLLTFTRPAEWRGLALAHAEIVLDRLMSCAWETVHRFSQNDRQLQGTPGAIAVLHTHSRRLDFHPPVHLVVPAAAVDAGRRRWRGKNVTDLFNAKALAKVFRTKMLAAIEAAGIALPVRYPKEWVVHCKSVGRGEKALIYLGRYLYRGVIREADILACEYGRVSFRYRNAQTGQLEKRSLAGADSLWLIVQHMLPKGFRRARNYGFLHANCKRLITWLPLLLKFDPSRCTPPRKQRPAMLCPCCGAVMAIVRTRIRSTSPGVIAITPLVAVAI